MFGTKSRCPGASSSVTLKRGVTKRAMATSTVTPRARSSGRSARTQAHEKEACSVPSLRCQDRLHHNWVQDVPGLHMPSTARLCNKAMPVPQRPHSRPCCGILATHALTRARALTHFACLCGLLQVLVGFFLAHMPQVMQQPPHQCGFSSIHMPHDHQVQPWPVFTLAIYFSSCRGSHLPAYGTVHHVAITALPIQSRHRCVCSAPCMLWHALYCMAAIAGRSHKGLLT